MAKKLNRTDFRVVVYPRRPGNYGWVHIGGVTRSEKESENLCESIKQDIRRHVDDIQNIEINWDSEKVCEFCGSTWSEDSAAYNGGCCGKDEENNPVPETASHE